MTGRASACGRCSAACSSRGSAPAKYEFSRVAVSTTVRVEDAMRTPASTIGAFSEDQAAVLTGVSKRQLGYWDKSGFFRPSFSSPDDSGPFARIYSFRDLVELR